METKMSMESLKRRVVVYIDGFNFYFGLKDMEWTRCYWLDFHRYAQALTKKLGNGELVKTKYFTARVSEPLEKRKRQEAFLDALSLNKQIQIIEGNYKESDFNCNNCSFVNYFQKEKQTDVSIAVELIMDAHRDIFDVAILISGDSDLVPAIKAVSEINSKKQITPCFPPKRHSNEIRGLTKGILHVTETDLRNCQLPDEIRMPNGYVIKRPQRWK